MTAHRRAEEQAELLRRRGADVVAAPVLRTLALDDDRPLRAATQALLDRPPDVVLALTGVGVRGWFAAAEAWGLDAELRQALAGARVWARGPKAEAAVLAAGLPVHVTDDRERLDHLLPRLLPSVAGRRVALQRYGEPVPWAVDALREAGADVVELPVYRWVPVGDGGAARRLVGDVAAGRVDAVTFTSAAAVRCLRDVAADLGRTDDLVAALHGRVVAAAVGPVTADALRALGVPDPCAPFRGRLGLLVRALSREADARHRHLRGEGGELVVRGGRVGPVQLAGKERDLFEALAERPGAVVGRSALERRVGAVDTTVARLRRSLAATGLAVAAVPRRGFALRAEVVACPQAASTSGATSATGRAGVPSQA